MTDKREAYEVRLNAELRKSKSQIDILKARAKQYELSIAGDEACDDVKTDAEKAWSEGQGTLPQVALKILCKDAEHIGLTFNTLCLGQEMRG